MEEKEKKYQITLTEDQMRLVSNALEDWSRFVAGQCEMEFATSLVYDSRKVKDILHDQVKPAMFPELALNESYGWSGSTCKNDFQRKAIAMSYMLYREIIHYLTVNNGKDMSWSTYNSPTLTCPEQGPLIKIEEVK